jgi:hypothetical protein
MLRKSLALIVIASLLCAALTFLPAGCGSSSSPTATSTTQAPSVFSDIAAAKNSAERQEAVQTVIKECRSLGVVDQSGKQLNPNVAADAISLTPQDIASLSYFIEIGHYRTLGSVVDFLAEAGVVLSSTGKVITWNDFLPDLQKYIQWSYNNRKDPDSTLGLLVASGPKVEAPATQISLEPTTQISPMAALLMLGDILVGVPQPEKQSSGIFIRRAYAADTDVQQTAQRILGLMTSVEKILKPAEATLDFFRSAAGKLGWTDPGEAAKPTQLKIPDMAKKLIGAFAAGNHFGVRILEVRPVPADNWPTVKSIELQREGQTESLALAVCLIPPGGSSDTASLEVLNQVPVMYKVTLVSPGLVSGDLYPDADVTLSSASAFAKTGANGHILDVAGKGITGNESWLATVVLTANKLDNNEDRTAILHVSASILAGDLAREYEKYSKEYGTYISALNLTPEDLQDIFKVMKTAINVSPTIAAIRLVGGVKVTIDPEKVTGEVGKGYTFTAKVDKAPPGSRWEWQAYPEVTNEAVSKAIKVSQGPDNVAVVSFPGAGSYNVDAVLWDGISSSAQVISTATAEVTIKPKEEQQAEIPLSIEPAAATGETGCSVSLNIVVPDFSKLPGKATWLWDYGDGSQPEQKGITYHSGGHAYNQPGSYTVVLKLIGEDGAALAETTAQVTVSTIDAIKRTRAVKGVLYAYRKTANYTDLNGALTPQDSGGSFTVLGMNTTKDELKWDGNRFSYTSGPITAKTQTVTYTISGSVSEQNGVIVVDEWKCTTDFIDTDQKGYVWTRKETLVLQNIPLQKSGCGDSVQFSAEIKGSDVQKYFKSYEYESRTVGGAGVAGDALNKSEGIDWTRTDGEYKIEMKFKVNASAGW